MTHDNGDIRVMVRAHFRDVSEDNMTIRFDEWDAILGIPSGSTKSFIFEIASAENYRVLDEAPSLAIFKRGPSVMIRA